MNERKKAFLGQVAYAWSQDEIKNAKDSATLRIKAEQEEGGIVQ